MNGTDLVWPQTSDPFGSFRALSSYPLFSPNKFGDILGILKKRTGIYEEKHRRVCEREAIGFGMEAAFRNHWFCNVLRSSKGKQFLGSFAQVPPFLRSPLGIDCNVCFALNLEEHMLQHNKTHATVFAVRRRKAFIQSEIYVLLEPGKSEVFVSEEELKIRLKTWLENWPGNALPPDLARFRTIDDAVSHLVRSVCELEVDGEVGSVQWYQVELE